MLRNLRFSAGVLTGAMAASAGISATSFASSGNYAEALQQSLYFYEAQMSGELPEWHRVPWRGPSALNDGKAEGVDLTGGMYDAGDHVKFGLPMSFTTTMLAWSMIQNPDGYQTLEQDVYAKRNLRWLADWLRRAHTAPNEFWGQVGNGNVDHAYWGPPEVMTMDRPAYKIDASCPGSDLAGEAAAALAASSMVFSSEDPAYASDLLKHARELYSFADQYRGRYSDCITDAKSFYNSWSGYQDELVWGAIWLYRATGETEYLAKAESEYLKIKPENGTNFHPYKWTLAWDDKSYGTYVLLASLTGKSRYEEDAERWLDYWTVGYEGQRISYTPGGLAWLDSWGSLRYASNTAFAALVYSDYLKEKGHKTEKADQYFEFAKSQIDYALGQNPSQRSYVVGFGDSSPRNPHHRAAHGSPFNNIQYPAENRHILYGALVGGPGRNDDYTDDRSNYFNNEVATDYNAGFTGALANLVEKFGGSIDPSFPPVAEKAAEYDLETKINAKGQDFIEIASRIVNQTSYPPRVPTALQYRYIVDLGEISGDLRDYKNVKVTTAYSQATTVSDLKVLDASRDLYYVEIAFDGQKIAPAGQNESRREVQFRLNFPKSWASSWSNENDWSFQGVGGNWSQNTQMPIYEDGRLVLGDEPTL